MTVELKKLSITDGMDIYNMLQEIPEQESGFTNNAYGLSFDEYKQWLIKNDNISKGIDLEDWMVPGHTYWLYVDGKPVGIGRLRIHLTEKLQKDGGHCGYAIAPSYRGFGYGTLLLNLLIIEANNLKLDKILLTIQNDNTVSLKVAANNGGVVEKVIDDKHYIWIDCFAE